jgi:AmmeMemoRadiSam system protein B
MSTRPPAVAGTFYPSDPAELRSTVEDLLARATPTTLARPVKALVVPHAGYIYSGPVAATGYRALQPQAGAITRVVLLGPSHRVAFQGLALPGVDTFATPLGPIPVDGDAVRKAALLPGVVTLPGAHALEHSLEVHLPFLQVVLGPFTLVPLCVGDAPPGVVASVLDALWGGAETLLVVSSDLSHYLEHAAARTTDARTVAQLAALRADITHSQACGATPLNGLMVLASRRHLEVTPLDVRSSGDTSGTRDRVVGYASLALT